MTMASSEMTVFLGDLPVGSLMLDHRGTVEFRWFSSYLNSYPRPALGQHFLDNPEGVYRSHTRLPPWFSNLLPEGLLRELVARQAQVGPNQEYALLRFLGADLPGAVRILPSTDSAIAVLQEDTLQGQSAAAQSWHFSLAGVQLKFSANRLGKGLTIPAEGRGGDWIVKLPSHQFAQVPQNEFATSNWARASGIEIPEVALMSLSDIDGLPSSVMSTQEQVAFAIRRFDRPAPGKRVHMEDFAQVLDLFPEQKYDHCNYETMAKVIWVVVGDAGLQDFLRRLVFMVASGNGDAHLKNWSLLYTDPVAPVLSPAYDLVSTIQYMPADRMALNLARSKQWTDVTSQSFSRLARKIGADKQAVTQAVAQSVELIRGAWLDHANDFGYGADQRRVIERHMGSVPLLQ